MKCAGITFRRHKMRIAQSGPTKTPRIQGFSRTEKKFQDFQGLENTTFNFKGFQGPVRTLRQRNMTNGVHSLRCMHCHLAARSNSYARAQIFHTFERTACHLIGQLLSGATLCIANFDTAAESNNEQAMSLTFRISYGPFFFAALAGPSGSALAIGDTHAHC